MTKRERAGWFDAGWRAANENDREAVLECPAEDADFSDDIADARSEGWDGDEVLAADLMRAGWDAARRQMLRDEEEARP